MLAHTDVPVQGLVQELVVLVPKWVPALLLAHTDALTPHLAEADPEDWRGGWVPALLLAHTEPRVGG